MHKLISILFLFITSAGFSQATRANKALLHAGGAGTSEANFFQDSRMNFYDIKYLKLDINVQPRSVFISSICSYKVLIQQPLDSFVMELRATMNVDSVFIDNNKSAFARRNDHIYVPINAAGRVGNLMNVSFYYKGNVATGFFSGVDAKGLEFTASVSEAYQAREWFPAKQILNDKIDSTDVWITTASQYKAGSNGLLKSVVALPAGLTQYRWSTRYPLNYYMPSVAAGNYLEYNIYAKPLAISPDSILVQNLVYNGAAYFTGVKAQIDKTVPFIEKFSELFGLYPFYKEKYGHSQANIGGGMEHATMTTLQSFDENLVAHELAHQWFGDNVTCATWNDIWLNESFATYSEYLTAQYLPSIFPKTAPQVMTDFHENVISAPGGSVFVPLELTYDEGRIFNYRLTYAKGATALHNLRFEMQSDTLFFNTLKIYQERFKNSFATTTDFKQVAEEVSRKNLTNFFNERIYGEGYPIHSVTFLKHGSDTLILSLSQATSVPSVTPLFTGLVQFKILSAQGDTTITVNQTANNQTFAIYYTKTPRGVEVDPNNWIVNRVGTITEGISTAPEIPREVKISPNPVTASAFTIKMPPNQFSALKLIDVNGRILKKTTIPAGLTTFTQDAPFAPGIYFVQLSGERENVVKKILINRK